MPKTDERDQQLVGNSKERYVGNCPGMKKARKAPRIGEKRNKPDKKEQWA